MGQAGRWILLFLLALAAGTGEAEAADDAAKKVKDLMGGGL